MFREMASDMISNRKLLNCVQQKAMNCCQTKKAHRLCNAIWRVELNIILFGSFHRSDSNTHILTHTFMFVCERARVHNARTNIFNYWHYVFVVDIHLNFIHRIDSQKPYPKNETFLTMETKKKANAKILNETKWNEILIVCIRFPSDCIECRIQKQNNRTEHKAQQSKK